jgi:CHAT domain-containing protein/tetratricopeptide (TPR) repeat protein
MAEQEKAIRCHEASLQIYAEIGDRANEAEEIDSLGQAYTILRKHQDALVYLQRALSIRREIDDRKGIAESLNNIGRVYLNQENLKEALSYFKRSLAIAREVGDRRTEYLALSDLGRVYDARYEPHEAVKYYEQALTFARETEDQIGIAKLLNNVGRINDMFFGRAQEALSLFKEALAILRDSNDLEAEAATLSNLGRVYITLGEPNEALKVLEQALIIRHKLNDRSDEGGVLNNIGQVYDALGKPHEALRYYEDALSIHRELGQRYGEATTLGNIGELYNGLGKPADAERYYKAALSIHREIRNRVGEATVLNNMAAGSKSKGNIQEALRYLEESLNIRRDIGDRFRQSQSLNNIGLMRILLGESQVALSYFEEALEISREVGDPNGEAAALSNMAAAYNELNKPEEALRLSSDALVIEQKTGNLSGQATTLNNIGRSYADMKQYPKACEHFELACGILERLRGEVLTDDMRTSFFEGALPVFGNYVYMLMEWQKTDGNKEHAGDAFNVWERGRARSLLDLIFEPPRTVLENLDETIIKQRQELHHNLALIQNQLMQPMLSLEEREQIVTRRDELDLALDQLDAKIRIINPHYGAYTSPQPLTLSQAQSKLLDEGAVLLEYALGDPESFLWVLSRHGWESYYLPPALAIKNSIEEFYKELFSDNDRYLNAAYELYNNLIKPAEQFIENTMAGRQSQSAGKLIIIPDGVLSFLPFELLLTEPSDRIEGNANDLPPYLIREYSIIYAPSVTVLETIKRERASAEIKAWKKDFIGFAPVNFSSADSLPYTQSEIESIARLFPANKATLLLHGDADRHAANSSELKDYRFIHFATHGYADNEKPQFCGLLFPDREGDALLYAFEIFNLDLEADLVTASSCVSGLGKQVQGEGMLGLVRSFLYAGASSVCVSLWNVSDESTADLMHKFYRHLVQGKMSKVESLRQAKLEIIQESWWANPYHWAAFILMGDWE